MPFLIDTNVAIYLRDGDPQVIELLNGLAARPAISVLTQVELENGVHAKPELTARRRKAVDLLLGSMKVHDFDADAASVYRGIIAATGFARSRIIDRMIAATAIAHGLSLITVNGTDFRDIPGLSLEVWPSPAV